jgi:hypothetical protein
MTILLTVETDSDPGKVQVHRWRKRRCEKIADKAWEIVATNVRNGVSPSDDAATDVVAVATFTERLLLIWRMLGEGKTQQAVADELGWKQQRVAQFAALQKVDEKALDHGPEKAKKLRLLATDLYSTPAPCCGIRGYLGL